MERQLHNGARAVPDERFVYYDVAGDSFRCAVTLLAQTQLMQSSYTVTYLPETGTILTVSDAAGKLPTRSFDLPYSLKKKEFNAVLELYEASVELGQCPNHGCHTDDGRIVHRAYCYGIMHSK